MWTKGIRVCCLCHVSGNEILIRFYRFQYARDEAPWTNRIPQDTDVLITHTPPQHHLDFALGCHGLLERVWIVKPKVHIFGHIHSGHGREAVWWDEAQRAYERLMLKNRGGVLRDLVPSSAWVDVLRVFWYGVKGVLWQRLMVGRGEGGGGLLVNASIIYQTAVEGGNPAQIVEL